MAEGDEKWLTEVAAGASRDAGGVPVALLGDYLPLLADADAAITALEAVIFDRLGDRDVLVATKDGLLVVLAPADATSPAAAPPDRDAAAELGRLMHDQLRRLPRAGPWQIAVGHCSPPCGPISTPAPWPPRPPDASMSRCGRSPTASTASVPSPAMTRPTRAHRFTLQAAVLGARALDWPQRPLPAAG